MCLMCLVVELWVSGSLHSLSAASFSADLAVSLAFGQPAGVALGVGAGPNLIPGCISVAIGNATAACTLPTSTFMAAAGTLDFHAGPASGTAGPPFASASAAAIPGER